MKKQFILLVIIILSLNVNSIAQIPAVPPQAFNYQAVLRDNNGSPLPYQNVSLKFSILDSALQIRYIETHDTITDQFGAISVEIGKGIPLFCTFDTVFWGSSKHYLQVAIDTAGSGSYTTLGTSELISVPYAMYAQYAGPWKFSPDPGSPPQLIYFHANPSTFVGIGTSTPEPSAILDLSSNNQGLLVPRLTTMQMISISPPAPSLLVFNIDSNRFYYYNNEMMNPHWDVIATTDDLLLKKSGIESKVTQTPMQTASGDVYIENLGSGVIMKSPNGNCWRMTVDNSGNPVFTQVACP